jgi:hypothetical protein
MSSRPFHDACSLVHAALAGDVRSRFVDELARSKPFGRALARLREYLVSNGFDGFLHPFDHRTRQEGFHALHDWDGKAEQVLGATIPVDVLDYVARQRGEGETSARALAILLDYYYFHVLSLLALRIWDEGSADDNLDRVGELLAALQGPGGSGQRFVRDAETLILVATSHFEAVERGYDRLLRRVRTLSRAHQLGVALGHASSMGCHLRFGFEATYRRDTVSMRDDNAADYPWLCYALVTLMREYTREDAQPSSGGAQSATGGARALRASVTGALANGLSADARAFIGAPPASLSAAEGERAEFRDAFIAHRTDLLAEFEGHRPVEGRYSPLSFFFNFSHNVLKGIVVDGAMRGEPWPVGFNDLLTGVQLQPDTTQDEVRLKPDTTDEEVRLKPDSTYDVREALARTLMDYARANPDRINGQPMPVIVYDPRAGHRAFRIMMEKLAE